MIKLQISKEHETYTVEFKNVDVDLEQLFSAFKGILVSLTWHESTINEFIIDLAEELKELEK